MEVELCIDILDCVSLNPLRLGCLVLVPGSGSTGRELRAFFIAIAASAPSSLTDDASLLR